MNKKCTTGLHSIQKQTLSITGLLWPSSWRLRNNKQCTRKNRFSNKEGLVSKVKPKYIALKWERKIANHYEHKRVCRQLKKDDMISMTTGIVDLGACLSCGGVNEDLSWTNEFSSKLYQVQTGQIVSALEKAKLEYNLCDPARDVERAPAILKTWMRVGKLANGGYVMVFEEEMVMMEHLLCQTKQ